MSASVHQSLIHNAMWRFYGAESVLVGSQTCLMLHILLTSDIWLLDAEGERTEGVTKPPLSHEYFLFWLYPDNTHHLNNTKELRFIVAKATRVIGKAVTSHPN